MSSATLEQRISTLEAQVAQLMKQNSSVSTDNKMPCPGAVDQALAEIWKTVPDSSWEQFPPDFGDQLDHYIYGVPKRLEVRC